MSNFFIKLLGLFYDIEKEHTIFNPEAKNCIPWCFWIFNFLLGWLDEILLFLVHCCTSLRRCESMQRFFFCTINILLGAYKCTCQGDVGAAAEARQKFAAPPPPAKQTERELLLSCHRFTTKLLPLEKYFHSISPRLSLSCSADLLHCAA